MAGGRALRQKGRSVGDVITEALLAIGIGAVVSYWVHRADYSQRMRAALFGLLVTLATIAVIAGAVTLALFYDGSDTSGEGIGWMLVVLSAGLGLPLIGQFRQLLGRVMPLDPASATDMGGLSILAAVAILVFYLSYTSRGNVGSTSVSYGELVLQSATFVLLGFLAVGAGMTRSWRDAVDRLGLERLTTRQVVLSVGLVVLCFAITILAGALTHLLQPSLSNEIQKNLKGMVSGVSSVPGALAIGISAGVGEEILFRGAIQPRYGTVFASLIWAIFHIQYGLSIVSLGIFVVGILFGLERRYLNTTASMITHIVYDVLAVLL